MKQKLFFTEIKDEAVISKLLNLCIRHKIRGTFWLKEQSLKFNAPFHKFFQYLRRLSVTVPSDITSEQLNDALELQSSNIIMANFQVDTLNFFFKTHFISFAKDDDDHFLIEIPKSIYKVQRRQNLRIPFARNKAPKVMVFDPQKKFVPNQPLDEKDFLEFRIMDISTGGLAFASSVENKPFLKTGTTLHNLIFRIHGTDITATGKITYAGEVMGDQKKPILKIGVMFVKLPMKFEKLIAQFTFNESRKLFSILD